MTKNQNIFNLLKTFWSTLFMKKILSTSISVFALAALTACGGGGEGESAGNGGGTSNSNITISLNPSTDVDLKSGDTYAIKAVATAKSSTISSLKWSVTALDGQPASVAPIVSDANCENISRSGGGTVNGISTSGNASCETYLVVSNAEVYGKWEVRAVASSASSHSAYQGFKVNTGEKPGGTTASGFKLVIPLRPIQVVEGAIASATAGYTVADGVQATNVKYEWSVVTGTANLAGANTETVSFVTATGGNYVLKVKVTATINGKQETVEGNVVVATTTPQSSNAFDLDAGATQIVNSNSVVTLKGVVTAGGTVTPGSFTYKWTQVSGPTVSLSNASNLTPSFIPNESGVYVFELSATNDVATKTARTEVVVNTISVSAGDAQIVNINSSTPQAVKLTAVTTGTTSAVTYTWTQTAGPTVEIVNANSAGASFVPTTVGTYRFTVTATVGSTTKTASTAVYVQGTDNVTVSAGDIQQVVVGTPAASPVRLSATVTGATSGITYSWVQTSGPTLELANANSQVLTFVPTAAGTYRFTVTATVNGTARTSSTIVYVSEPATSTPVANFQ